MTITKKRTKLFPIEDLPDWQTGTDRQIGRALWKYLRSRGEVSTLMRSQGVLVPSARLSTLLAVGKLRSPLIQRREKRRDINASINEALALAARGQFLAAGALYKLCMQRIREKVIRDEKPQWNKYRRAQGAKKARKIKSDVALACQKEVARLDRDSPRRVRSAIVIASKIGRSPSTVRRYRRNEKKAD